MNGFKPILLVLCSLFVLLSGFVSLPDPPISDADILRVEQFSSPYEFEEIDHSSFSVFPKNYQIPGLQLFFPTSNCCNRNSYVVESGLDYLDYAEKIDPSLGISEIIYPFHFFF